MFCVVFFLLLGVRGLRCVSFFDVCVSCLEVEFCLLLCCALRDVCSVVLYLVLFVVCCVSSALVCF